MRPGRIRFIIKMALAVSLRRALLMLLMVTVFVLLVLYWNQNVTKPVSFISTFETSLRNRTPVNIDSNPPEKTWTYKCEGDKCIRQHYLTEDTAEKRVPFMTCSMTCGDINIWPHPTIKTAFSSKSLRFTVFDIELSIKTEFKNIETIFRNAFGLFLIDLKHIEKLDISSSIASNSGNNFNNNNRNNINNNINNNNNFVSNNQILNNNQNSNSQTNSIKQNNEIHSFLIKQKRLNCDIDKFVVEVNILKSNEVHLTFDTDESYNLTTGYDKRKMTAIITANSYFGARHALATLQQMIWYDDEDDILRVISKSIISDVPRFKYRGLMLDTSRHFFSVESIKRTLTAMSYVKLNRFHWHITDSQSFPYVSKHYPELAAHGAYSEHETYTFDDVKEIVEFAQVRGIQIIPEIDAPAHAGNGWEWGPKKGLGELSLCINQQPWSFYCGEPPCGQLNPKNNNTYLILQKLYEELLNLTGPTDYFHLGGDEVNLECWGQYFNDTDLRGMWCDFMTTALQRLKIANNNKLPKYVSVWSSGLTNTHCLSKKQFVVQVWGGSTWQENYDLLDNGFNLIISHVDAWYLDCGFGSWRATGDAACSPYRTWQNVYKHRPWDRMRLDPHRMKQILGGEACLWTEQVDEAALDNRLWPRTAAIAERLWTDPDDEHDFDAVPREVFSRMGVFRNRLIELDIKAEPIFPKYCAQNPGECV
ncbi:probable beta-hexosaminidase fdl isoform X2 [Condylostylus longicornis]|uniref:probable beta-hexosaminidase fdl isoform X2 n=1 Tax=Condylostylus longicornis TaxID=2530218 RepID=UPI00244DF3D6|nr:probable beta-hexosaminidase fdl isoform X2 [Condylostylus longicornis]